MVAALRAAGCVFAEDEAAVLRSAASTPEVLASMLARRVAGEPLEHVVGWAEFAGLRIAVAPGVFVPRRRTVFLAERAIDALAGRTTPTVVELCCGSGAIAAAVLRAVPAATVHAADIEARAVTCARINLPHASVHQGDLYAALPETLRATVDVIVANAPYVPSDAVAFMPPEARDHEPRQSLDGGPDGLDVHRRIAAAATTWLAPGGVLLIEVGVSQVPTALAMFEAAGLTGVATRSENYDATVVSGSAQR